MKQDWRHFLALFVVIVVTWELCQHLREHKVIYRLVSYSLATLLFLTYVVIYNLISKKKSKTKDKPDNK
jgi:hypothetical protein